MAHNLVVLEWLYKADQDFGFASLALGDATLPYFDQICFHFHQAAEKYLKAYIVKYDLPFRKVHDLRKLCDTCSTHDSSFSTLIDACLFLNPFYIETRYADDRFMVANEAQAQKAQQCAKQVQAFVRERVDASGEVTADLLQRENKKIDEVLKNKS